MILSVVYSVVYSAILPDRVPTHWNIHGQVDGYGSKWLPLLMGPCLVAMVLVFTLILPALSPKGFRMDRFGRTYAYVFLLCSVLMAALHALIVQGAAGSSIAINQALLAVVFLFFALFGNVMGKVKRNFYVGVRTPWTLASEDVWDATHKSAARLWFWGGLVGVLLAIVGTPLAIMIALLLGMAFWPVAESYMIYRRMEGGA